MLYRLAFILVLLSTGFVAHGHRVVIKPYLQNPTPTSIVIAWESVDGETSVIQWGLGDATDQRREGNVRPGPGQHRYHWVELNGLEPATRYAYRVLVDGQPGPTYHFKTAPAPESEASFRLVAMSDMQRDNRNPDRYREVVEEGVIDFVRAQFGERLVDQLGLVLVPGDLVAEGPVHSSWAETFFTPGEALMSYVPFLPVPGNHERDVQFFFDYFHLPENGTPGFEEHWWYTDYSNVRIIGLDSNGEYRIPEQLEWLDQTLADACASDHIDFVFAQLHHPFESELWPVGNTAYTGRVIERLETFSTGCEKPSIHFFGHTHGYSRGQSRDHHHLMVNVASAGGNIDYWGEYSQTDYDSFTVSQDEYGFVVVEVEAGPAPRFSLRRVSRGNEIRRLENVVSDQVEIRLLNDPPSTPTTRGPLADRVNPDCFGLAIMPFADPDDDAHQASHWQVSAECNDFSTPVIDSWLQRHNWYDGVDRQADDDLEDVYLTNLEPDSTYCWRMRVRDEGLTWSAWSQPEAFATGASTRVRLPLVNPGGEQGTEGWVVEDGIFESLAAGECNGTTPRTGDRYLAVGGICESADIGRVSQTLALDDYQDRIQAGEAIIEYGAYVRNFDGRDHPQMVLRCLTDDGQVVRETEPIGSLESSWTLVSGRIQLPLETARIALVLSGRRNAGTDNDSYFDDAFVNLVSAADVVCDEPPPAIAEADAGVPVADAMVADAANSHDGGDVDGGVAEADLAIVDVGAASDTGQLMLMDPDATGADMAPAGGPSTRRSRTGGCASVTLGGQHGPVQGTLLVCLALVCLWRRRARSWAE